MSPIGMELRIFNVHLSKAVHDQSRLHMASSGRRFKFNPDAGSCVVELLSAGDGKSVL